MKSRAIKSRFMRAMPITFGVHLTQTLIAVFAASVWSAGMVAAFGGHPEGVDALRDGGPIAVETLSAFFKTHAGFGFGFTGAVALAWWIASIPVQLVWLQSHEQGLDRVAVVAALRRMFPALGASLLMVLPLVLVLGVLVGLPMAWAWFMGGDPDVRARDLGVLLAMAPGALLWLLWGAWFDMTRAGVLLGLDPIDAIKTAWRVRAGHIYAGWWLLGLVMSLLAVALGGPAWWILIGGQLALLARTYVRSAWWSCALGRMATFLTLREGNHVREP